MAYIDKSIRVGIGWDTIRGLWRHARLPHLLLLLYAFAGVACTHVGVARPKGGSLVAGVTSFMGEVITKDVKITTAEGDTIEIGAVASHNPDRAVTKAVRDVVMFKAVAPILMEGVKGASAATLKGVKDPNIIPKDPNFIPVDPQFVPPPIE